MTKKGRGPKDKDDVSNFPNSVPRDTVNDTVKDTQKKILNLLAENPRMTTRELSAEIGINERNIKEEY